MTSGSVSSDIDGPCHPSRLTPLPSHLTCRPVSPAIRLDSADTESPDSGLVSNHTPESLRPLSAMTPTRSSIRGPTGHRRLDCCPPVRYIRIMRFQSPSQTLIPARTAPALQSGWICIGHRRALLGAGSPRLVSVETRGEKAAGRPPGMSDETSPASRHRECHPRRAVPTRRVHKRNRLLPTWRFLSAPCGQIFRSSGRIRRFWKTVCACDSVTDESEVDSPESYGALKGP